jgi:hypothetical protein
VMHPAAAAPAGAAAAALGEAHPCWWLSLLCLAHAGTSADAETAAAACLLLLLLEM